MYGIQLSILARNPIHSDQILFKKYWALMLLEFDCVVSNSFRKKNVLCITLKDIYKMLILYLYVMAFDDVVVFTLELDFSFKSSSSYCASCFNIV